MDKKMSDKEIKKIIDKISAEYEKYSNDYGESFFSKKAYKERYMNALKKNMNLQAFAYAEIAFLEELKEKWSLHQEERRIKTEKPFTQKIEKYIEEMEEKWNKYPRLFEDLEISNEAQFFLGAVQMIYNNYWLELGKLIKKEYISEIREYNTLTDAIQKFVLSFKNRPPFEVDNYIFNLEKVGIERANMLFLKEAANLLKQLKQFLKKNLKTSEQSNELLIERYSNKAEADSQKKMLSEVLDFVEQIIEDFRFTNLI